MSHLFVCQGAETDVCLDKPQCMVYVFFLFAESAGGGVHSVFARNLCIPVGAVLAVVSVRVSRSWRLFTDMSA